MRHEGFSARASADDHPSLCAGTDAALLDYVGAMLRRLDPVPPRVTNAAHELLTWRTVDADLAALLCDARRSEPPAAR